MYKLFIIGPKVWGAQLKWPIKNLHNDENFQSNKMTEIKIKLCRPRSSEDILFIIH